MFIPWFYVVKSIVYHFILIYKVVWQLYYLSFLLCVWSHDSMEQNQRFYHKTLMTYYGNLTVPLCLPKTAFHCTLYRPSVFFNLQWTYLMGFQSAHFAFILFFFIKIFWDCNFILISIRIFKYFILVLSCWAQR